jgi:HEAT repeat protein
MHRPQLISFALMLIASVCSAADKDDIAKLVAQLKDNDPRESARAAQSLASLGNSAGPAIAPLIHALSDTRIADDIPFAIPAPRRDVASFASEALGAIGAAAVPSLARELKTQDKSARRRVMETLQRIGRPAREALPHLKTIVENEEAYELRYIAVESYAAICSEDRKCVALLANALTDKSPHVRGLAARKLGDLASAASSAVPALTRTLADEEYRWHFLAPDAATQRAVRFDAAEALGKIGLPAKDAAGRLATLMTGDTDPEVRVSAALALFRIDNNSDAMKTLIEALQNDERGIAGPEEAARSLAELGPKAAPAFDALIESLKHRHEFVRMSAVRAIRAIGGKKAVSVLMSTLKDKNPQVREAAAESLGELGPLSAPAVSQLVESLNDDDDVLSFYVRHAAAEALGKIGPSARSAIPHLERLQESDSDASVREIAADALKQITRDK